MLLTEYDEKKHMKMVRRDAKAEGNLEKLKGMLKIAAKAETIEEYIEKVRVWQKL